MARAFSGLVVPVVLGWLCLVQPALGQSGQPPKNWNQLSPADRAKAQEKYDIYKKMPRDRQQEIQRNYREWQGMPSSEREEIRRNYDAYRSLTPEQRRSVGEIYQQKRGGR